jgi:hypothetical protein
VSESRNKRKGGGRDRRDGAAVPLLPGFFELFRMPDGSAVVRPKELADEMSVRQAGAILKLSKTTIKWLCDIGHLQRRWATPLPGKRLIKAASLFAFRDARTPSDA